MTIRLLLPAALLLLLPQAGVAEERVPLVADWSFVLDNAGDSVGKGPPDSGWRTVQLPHDWSIELPTSPDALSKRGGGYFRTGTGWYRKTFDAPLDWRGQDVSVYFDGVYRNAEVWLNGIRVGGHVYGYTPFRISLTESLRIGKPNELLIRVANNAQPDSRWYTGSGIYRPVFLELRSPTHFEPDSLFVTTRALTEESATLDIRATVVSPERLDGDGYAKFTLAAPGGREVTNKVVALSPPEESDTTPVAVQVAIPDPQCWAPETPMLYTLIAELGDSNGIVEVATVRVGVRTLRWSAQRGFELNGESLELFGGSVHHDNGALGAAAYRDAERRKVQILKSAGFNAVRTAHNPPSESFLDAADTLGLLVIDEAFDAWNVAKIDHDYAKSFEDHWEADLRAMVVRDRNHPSVIMWSIGNEVYERGTDSGIDIAHAMAAVIRQLDRSRPVTIGLNGLGASSDWNRLDGIFDGLDIAGYNYELGRSPSDHERRPNRIIYASESFQNEVLANWQLSRDHTYVIGDFVWSAIDYLGESGIGRVFPSSEEVQPHWIGDHYPHHGALSGDIDITGTRKPISHYREIIWDRGEKLYAAVLVPSPDGQPWNLTQWSTPPALSSWTWPGMRGRDLTLEVYSRHPRVSVYVDGVQVGEAATSEAEAFRASFDLPYRPGRLEVRAGDEVFVLQSAGRPTRLRFVNTDGLAIGDDRSVYFVQVEIVDAQGTWHPHADRPISFSVDGGRILAIGSGDMTSTETYRANPRKSFQGRSLLVFEADPDAARVTLNAKADGLETAELILIRNSDAPARVDVFE